MIGDQKESHRMMPWPEEMDAFIKSVPNTAEQIRKLAATLSPTLIRHSGRESIQQARQLTHKSLEARIPDQSSQGFGLDIYFIRRDYLTRSEKEGFVSFTYSPEQGYFYERSVWNPTREHWVSQPPGGLEKFLVRSGVMKARYQTRNKQDP